jgi:hypothetical protein
MAPGPVAARFIVPNQPPIILTPMGAFTHLCGLRNSLPALRGSLPASGMGVDDATGGCPCLVQRGQVSPNPTPCAISVVSGSRMPGADGCLGSLGTTQHTEHTEGASSAPEHVEQIGSKSLHPVKESVRFAWHSKKWRGSTEPASPRDTRT